MASGFSYASTDRPAAERILLPYLIFFGFLAASAIAEASRPIGSRRRGLFIAGLALVIFIGFRYAVGRDWSNYLLMFSQIERGNLAYAVARTDPMYGILNWIAAQTNWGIWFPNVVCAVVFTWGLTAFCRQQPNPRLGLVVAMPYLIVGVAMGFTRQSAALGIIMLTLAHLGRDSIARTLAKLLFSVTFHMSAVIITPMLAYSLVRRGFLSVLSVAVVGLILYFQLQGHIFDTVEMLGERQKTAVGAAPRLAMNALPAAIFLGFRHRFAPTPDEVRLWTVFSVGAIGAIAILFILPSSTVIDRIGVYIVPLQIYVFCRVPTVFGADLRQSMFITFVIIIYLFLAQVAWFTLGTAAGNWLPYRNYLWELLVSS